MTGQNLSGGLAALESLLRRREVVDAVNELVTANRILFNQGVVDGFGHVSARCPGSAAHFLLSRSMAPSLVTADDIILLDLDAQPVTGDKRKLYAERFIHSEIYRARTDVLAIVHSHSPSIIPFTVSSVSLQPVFHMGGFLTDVRRFDIRASSGRMTDMLVRDPEMGTYLAHSLGPSCISLMRGHGSVAVGRSVKEVVYRAVYAEINARIQTASIGLGGQITYLSDEEAMLATESTVPQYDRAWELWARAVAVGE
jgi:ribulose-5-phosphate 4-epimerase/fuculose-1-phosphate aldolase